MKTNWVQTFTIIFSMAGMFGVFFHVSYTESNKHREDSKRHDTEFQETRKLWARLLQENQEIAKKSHIVEQELLEIKKQS